LPVYRRKRRASSQKKIKKSRPLNRKKKTRGSLGPVRIYNALQPNVSVIIPVMNERRTLPHVLLECSRVHPQTEVIVVVNGSTDGSAQVAKAAGAKVIEYAYPLGHDVGRSVGAQEAKGEILLFVDGDFVIRRKDLIPFINSIENGTDVALNRYLGPVKTSKVHPVILSKHMLNGAICRPDLVGSSMTTIPHAISRKALDWIGTDALAVPPKALAIAVHNGLHVKAVHLVQVGKINPRKRRGYKVDPLLPLIIGDHLEALHWLISQAGERGSFEEHTRVRDVLG
jgi:glycosyltransferase involved in cell wall biosynthesis